jgi:hypothetical protein
MRYYRRTGRNRAISANLTVWRRLLAMFVALLVSGAFAGSPLILIPLGIAVFAFCSAIHVAILKLRTTSWP